MKTRFTCVAIALAVLAFLTGAISTGAATLSPYYVVGGIVQWSARESTEIAFHGPSSSFRPPTATTSSTETKFRLGGGYSFNENWAIEASYVAGPTQELSIKRRFLVYDINEFFTLDGSVKLDLTLLRVAAVYELPLREPISFIANAGLAFPDFKEEFSYQLGGSVQAQELVPIPDSVAVTSEDTKLFASTGLRVSFNDRRVSASLSFVYYDDFPQMDTAFEFDLQWRL